MPSLTDVTTPTDGTLTIREGWRQGSGAYGGLTIAAAIRAIEAKVADPSRTVRSVTAELPAPALPGTLDVDVDILRSGKSLTVARAALRQGDNVTTHAVAILAATRDAGLAWNDLAPPKAPPPEALRPVPANAVQPEFCRHFEYRLVSGTPFGGENTSMVIGWVRALDPGPARDAAYLAAMIDVWWPAIFGRMSAPRPMATIAFTLEVVSSLDGEEPAAPLLHRGTVSVVHDGYFQETRELWTASGRLLARNHQTFAIIK